MKNMANKSNSLISNAFNFHHQIDILSTEYGPEEIISTRGGYQLRTKHLAAYIIMQRGERTFVNAENALDSLFSAFFRETKETISFLETAFQKLMEEVIILN